MLGAAHHDLAPVAMGAHLQRHGGVRRARVEASLVPAGRAREAPPAAVVRESRAVGVHALVKGNPRAAGPGPRRRAGVGRGLRGPASTLSCKARPDRLSPAARPTGPAHPDHPSAMTLPPVFRKLRAAAGLAATWSLAWAAAGVVPALLLVVLFRDGSVPPLQVVRGTVFGFAAAGLVAGAAFSLLLGAAYRHRRLAELRPRRVGLWGMAGAVALTFVGLRILAGEGADIEPPVGIALLVVAGALGWATAAAGVRLAQGDRRVGGPAAVDAALPHEEPRHDALGAPTFAGSPTFTHTFTKRNA